MLSTDFFKNNKKRLENLLGIRKISNFNLKKTKDFLLWQEYVQ